MSYLTTLLDAASTSMLSQAQDLSHYLMLGIKIFSLFCRKYH